MRSNFFEWGLKGFPEVVGIDGDENCCKHARSLGVYSELWHRLLPAELPEKSFDTVLASEIIEHLQPEQRDSFLAQLEKTARLRVIITTPNSECLRRGSDGPLGFNGLDAHHSCMTIRQFRDRGYTVHGAGFGNRTYLRTRILARFARMLGLVPEQLFVGFSYRWPHFANTLVAYRDIQ